MARLRFSREISYFSLTFMYFTLSLAVVDLNRQQMQFIADHLTDIKCMELMEALNETTFQVDANALLARLSTASMTTMIGETPREFIPCINRLETWSKGQGKVQTFDILVIRLKEIDMPKLADRVSRMVMGETNKELHRFFLDDPFKKLVPTKSVIVDAPQVTAQDVPAPDVKTTDDGSFRALLVTTVACVFLLVTLMSCVTYAKTLSFVCHRACPRCVALTYDMVSEGCLTAWDGARNNVGKYMLLSQKNDSGGLAI